MGALDLVRYARGNNVVTWNDAKVELPRRWLALRPNNVENSRMAFVPVDLFNRLNIVFLLLLLRRWASWRFRAGGSGGSVELIGMLVIGGAARIFI